ncbi:MAG: hypothetical protein K0R99_4761 [Microbacterium sp.]|jgi:hypothetical protein|uniref:hypothetical protein n=1 Tax=Microbacterium sp. TaxID=51671 RepID=UPI00262E5FC7|nr:hypothetical protein [Microbacterium sp.]MDF2563315.1 hypothetical protein [Microbacterium sp.]
MVRTNPGKAHTGFTIRCTDKGQHPSREIAQLAPKPQYNEKGVWIAGDQSELGQTWDEWGLLPTRNRGFGEVVAKSVQSGGPGRPWRFTCTTCGRSPEISDQNLGAIVMGYIDRGVFSLDVSAIR